MRLDDRWALIGAAALALTVPFEVRAQCDILGIDPGNVPSAAEAARGEATCAVPGPSGRSGQLTQEATVRGFRTIVTSSRS